MAMNRRDFIKISASGVATLVVGSHLPWLKTGVALAAQQTLTITITDALKEMITHQDPKIFSLLGMDPTKANQAECYFWIYKMSVGGTDLAADCPGPTIVGTVGDTIQIEITNSLDENHSFYIPGAPTAPGAPASPPQFDARVDAVDKEDGVTKYPNGIPPGKTVVGTITLNSSGPFLYHDNLNSPVNRMMGLHGALLVMPKVKKNPAGKWTPYDNPTDAVQELFNDFGDPNGHFPGLAWEEGDPSPWKYSPDPMHPVPNCTPFRTYAWVLHQASPKLFAKVGAYPEGQDYPAAQFVDEFLRSPFSPTRNNFNPEFFTINGQSGFFAHFSPTVTPTGRIGEPVVVHMINAGLWTHAMHFHANHFYVTYNARLGGVSPNPLWCDTYNIEPMDTVDYVVPFHRPPDIPTVRGLGLPEEGIQTRSGFTWPPTEELNTFIPEPGDDKVDGLRFDALGNPYLEPDIDLHQRLSPLCFPMHDHCEPSQTAQGGNYNMGLISGLYITGDRSLGAAMDFPMDEDFRMMFRNIRGLNPVATGAAAAWSGVESAPGAEPDHTGH